ncbi:ABC transporter substrate-binding protein [Comamonas endophytica]|uniref:ABC transporter substrate-binding protein n=1 Tax=Comamonas endophytica TaxID=2949090 RepID=A0ABY6G9R3_9BURK|nr:MULTISPECIES: ABC transporter substrate-binding protein [unclassified Acidovorax]MCD2514178.1 ABC transporter substrate-binding protein [Acidovorax sp. D4N7]UYG51317.1 ABC transporter substrate-binding protein [Acidovorax sp. 5MLIR]
MFKRTVKTLTLVAALGSAWAGTAAHAADSIKLGYAKCAHCSAVALVPAQAENGVQIEGVNFNTGNDVLTALVSKNLDVAQVTYLHFVTALDKGFDVVAIAGQINGGSRLLISSALPVQADDWAGLKKTIADFKAQGKPFRVGASRGNAQDLHMRGTFAKHGIDVNKDLQFVNIPNPADHLQALRRNEVEMISAVDPFAAQIVLSDAAKLFSFPYDQAAGKLSNLIVTRSDVLKAKPAGVLEAVRGVIKVNAALGKNQTLFVDTIQKATGLPPAVAQGSVSNLYPDHHMYRPATKAIAQMMYDLKYLRTDVTPKIDKAMDYSFLEKVTGQPKAAMGY